MAVNNVSASSYAAALKVLQEGALNSLLPESEDFFKMIKGKFTKGSLEGKEIVLSAKDMLGHAAVKFIGYNGNFATRQKANYQNIKIAPKFLTAHVEIERPEQMLGKSQKGGWVDLLKDEIASKNQAMAQQLARSCFGDGSGVFGTVATAVTANNQGVITLSTTSSARGYVSWFEIGDFYEVLDASNSYAVLTGLDNSSAAYAIVKDVDIDNNKVYFKAVTSTGAEANWNPSTALAAGDLLVRKGSTYTDGATVVDTASEEIVGFDGIISDASTTLFNIDRGATPLFKGVVKDGGGELLNLGMLHQAAKKAGLNGGKLDMMVVSYDTYIRLSELGEAMRAVISSPSMNVNLGIETITYSSPTGGKVPIAISRYCPSNKIFMLDSKTFELRGEEPAFVEDDGNTLRLKPNGTGYSNVLTGELFGAIALFSKAPNKSAKITNFVNTEA